MNILKDFEDFIIRTTLFEHAFYRKTAHERIGGIGYMLFYHLLKVKIIKNKTGNIEHWKKEIRNFIAQLYEIRYKPYSKKFKNYEYLEWMFVEPFCDSNSSAKRGILNVYKDFIKNMKYRLEKDYNIEVNMTNEDIEECKNIMIKISDYLADNLKIEKIEDIIRNL